MAEIYWANAVDGSFTNASYWIGGVAPGSADDAILDAAGATPYTVTVSTTGTVAGIQTAANATLEVSGVRFDVTAGTDAGVNAGTLAIIDGGYLELQGSVVNSGAIEVAGSNSKTTLDLVNANLNGGGVISLGDYAGNQILGGVVTNINNTIEGSGTVGMTSLTNAGEIDATGVSVALEITVGALDNTGLIESTGSAGMLIHLQGVFETNTGTIEANGSGLLTIYQDEISNYGGEITATKGSTLNIYGIGGIDGGTLDIAAGATMITGKAASGNVAFVHNSDFENAGLIAVSSSYGALVVEGGITNTGAVSLNASGHFSELDVIDDLTLTGGGMVALSDDAGNAITNNWPGRSNPPAATFTNVDNTIAGAGTIGDGVLSVFNDAKGIIDATGTINFLEIAIGASFANAGLIETTGPAGMLILNGTTSASGTIVNTGSIEAIGAGPLAIEEATIEGGAVGVAKGGTLALDAGGTLAGSGTLSLVNGAAAFGAGSDLAFADVTMSGNAATATFATSNLAYAGLWTQTGGTVSASARDRVNFTGAGDVFSGTIGGAGTVAFTGGADTLDDVHVTAFNPVINGATVTLNGAIGLSGVMSVSTKDLIIAAGGASLGGGGALVLSNLSTNKVSGGTLTNVNDYIKGAGALGDGSMGLINDAGGIIDGDDSVALTIDTGSSAITSAGTIEATSKGTTTIASAVDNTGVLGALDGSLTVDGAVTGTGKVEINAGTADFAGAFTQNVAFLGAGDATLELAHSEAYTGEISGFSRTGTTALDLEDIPFVSGTTTASYSGTTTSGVLTVMDGSQIARITLEGNYTKSSFTLSSDGHGGTGVVDPPVPSSVQSFIAAAAAIGGGAGESIAPTREGRLLDPPMLARPGTAAA